MTSRPAWKLAAVMSALCALSCVTPSAVSDQERLARSRADMELLYSGQPAPAEAVDFYGAVARAVKFNLDHRVQRLEEALARREVLDARLDLLPQVMLNNEYYGRSNELASASESVITGRLSLEPSRSQERYGWRDDLTVAFNLLDFGMTWVTAAQEANEALAAKERRLKATQDLMLDVRGAYWRAAGAEGVIPELDRLIAEAKSALEDSRGLQDEGLLDPVTAMSYQRSLVERIDELGELRRDLELARVQLASLLNLRPGARLELAAPEVDAAPIPRLDLPLEELEVDALVSRPELREQDYQLRISQLEVRRAMLRILPSIDLGIGRNSDTNKFLVNSDWWNYSAVLAKNLVEVVTAPVEIGVARFGADVVEARRMALSMAVVGQVHVAYREFVNAHQSFEAAREAREIDRRIHQVTLDRLDAESETGLELVRKDTDRLVGELRYRFAYADLQEAYGRMLNVVGVRPPLDDVYGSDVELLTRRIRETYEQWERRAVIPRPGGPIPASAEVSMR